MGCGASARRYTPDEAELQEIIRFLGGVPLLQGINEDQLRQLARSCQLQDYAPSEVVFRVGDTGKELFVIKSGQAHVFINPGAEADEQAQPDRQLKAGDYFGEKALLHDTSRTATVMAATAMKALSITRAKFQELDLSDLISFPERRAVGQGGCASVLRKDPDAKTPQERSLIAKALWNNKNLQVMVKLDAERVEAMIDICWKEKVEQGNAIISESDVNADYFYVIQEGDFQVYRSAPVEEAKSLSREHRMMLSRSLNTLGPGGSFGEMALLCLAPRSASVKALSNGVMWVFDRDSFKRILMQHTNAQIQKYVEIIKSSQVLRCLLADERETLATSLTELHYGKGEIIVEQGQIARAFYILYDGQVSVIEDGKQVRILQASHGSSPALFGERALLNDERRTATVKVVSSCAKVFLLDRDTFNMILGPLEAIQNESKQGPRRASKHQHLALLQKEQQPQERKQRIEQNDLTRIGVLGAGGFGTVVLVGHKTMKDKTFALKCMSKGHIVKCHMKDSVLNEKAILSMANSPFVIRLYATYKSDHMLFMLMEAALGGELHTTFRRKDLYGSQVHAQFYSGCVALGLHHLHSLKVVYRDLKPENVLLDSRGYAKLTDMGLAKVCPGITFTVCGTPDYFAPELLSSRGHGLPLDWWTLGVLIFELLAGSAPFESPEPMLTYSKISKGISRVTFPVKCQGEAESLIRALLETYPSKRLPMLNGGFANLQRHKWYSNLDWTALQNLKVSPPYKPVVKNVQDMSNFRSKARSAPVESYQDDGSGWDKDYES